MNDIQIHEWPSGCELVNQREGLGIVIREPNDARRIIEALTRFLEKFPKQTTDQP